MKLFTRFLLLCYFVSQAFLQAQETQLLWRQLDDLPRITGEQRIQPEAFQLLEIDFRHLSSVLNQAPEETFPRGKAGMTISLPMPDGTFEQFEVFKTWVLNKQDKDRFPGIRTFVAYGIDNPYAYARLDFTPHGFHAMILTEGESYWIDPYVNGNTTYYMSYRKSDLQPRADEDYSCQAEELDMELPHDTRKVATLPVGPQLRVYEIAVTCVGEYAQFHGGTVPLAQAAIVTTLNRVTGIFERDMSIRLVLIPNNDALLFADPNTDPYSCCDISTTLDDGANFLETTLGINNFDLGHTFATYGGGLAAFGVCEDARAFGITGLTNPVGDPFDVDYVSHEIGHQFHASHTFNFCPGQGGVPHEPGSGSTIMAYAGLCGAANIQTFSVDAFSVGTYEESVTFTQLGNGNNCPDFLNTGNSTPTVALPDAGFFIPKSTPFELTAVGNDVDGDSLTYSWEQFDLGPNVSPDSPVGNAPLFRVLWPTPDSTRIFPQIDDIVMGTQTIGERLPDYGRVMTFRCAIRDNRGGADFEQMEFFVSDTAGPFVVTYPNTGVGFWTAGSIQNISWEVAKTDLFPINCQEVDIYLSTDGGYTYPILLASGRPNTGATAITVPNVLGSNMRVKIKGAGNHFFDISDSDFSIVAPATADYSMTVNDPNAFICGMDTAIFVVELDTLGTFLDSVNLTLNGLPTGTAHSLSPSLSPSPATIELKIWNLSATQGTYSLILQANSSSGIKNMPLSLQIRDGVVPGVSLASPFNGATGVSNTPTLSWNAIPFITSYRIQIALSPTFSMPVVDESGLNTTTYTLPASLDNSTVYYWRVQVDTSECGSGPWGTIYSFQTPLVNCATYNSTDVPVIIPSADVDTVYSQISVPNSLILTDVNVHNLEGTHTWMDDLGFTLISPLNTRVTLFEYQCGDQDDFWLSFDDTASINTIPCPPTTGEVVQPFTPLVNFNGEDALGNWTLEIIDRFAADGGQLDRWAIELCGPAPSFAPPTLTNDPLSILQGDSTGISSIYLEADCADSSSHAVYTLVSLPVHGSLFLNSQTLAVGDTFTQADINTGLLTYEHDSLTAVPDGFQFTLNCESGGYVGGLSFAIQVDTVPVGIRPLAKETLLIYPNPAQEWVNVKVENTSSADLRVVLFDLMGRSVRETRGPNHEIRIPLSGLSQGWYSVAVWSQGRFIGSTKVRKD